MKTEQMTTVEKRASDKRENLVALLRGLRDKMPTQECWEAFGPKTFDKNWDKGWNKDGH
jgi:hypothetical protein